MSDSAVATSTPPRNEDQNQNLHQKSPSPSNENIKLAIEEKSDDDECLIIDESNGANTNDAAPSTQLNGNTEAAETPKSLDAQNGSNGEEAQKANNNDAVPTKEINNLAIEATNEEKPVESNVGEAQKSTVDDKNPDIQIIESDPPKLNDSSETSDLPVLTNEAQNQKPSNDAPDQPITTSSATKTIWSANTLTQTSTTNSTSTTTTQSNSTPKPTTEPQTLVEALSNKAAPVKKPRQRKPNANKNQDVTQQQQTQMMPMMPPGATFHPGQNGQPPSVTLPPGFRINQNGQIVSTATNNSPNAPMILQTPASTQFRQYAPQPHYYMSSPSNGQFICIQAPNITQAPSIQPTQQQTAGKGGQKKSAKDKDQNAGKVNNPTQQAPIMMMPGNIRLQMAPTTSIQQQTPQIFQQQIVNKTTSTATSAKPGQPSITTTANGSYLAPGHFLYQTRAPNGSISFRQAPGQPLVIPGNLVPVNMPANVTYQFLNALPTMNVQQDIPPPPTLSPNPVSTNAKSPKPVASGKKKKSGTSNGSSANGTPQKGMFSAESAKFINRYTTNISNLTSSIHLKPLPTPKITEEKMELDNDLNDDEPPPKIECEGHAERLGPNETLSGHQKANQRFFQDAHQQKLASQGQPLLKKHYVDGRIIEEEIPASKFHHPSSPTKQRKVGQPPCSLPAQGRSTISAADIAHRNAAKSVLNNFSNTLKGPIVKTQSTSNKVATAPSRPFQPPPLVRPASYEPSPTTSNNVKSPTIEVKKELKSPTKSPLQQQRLSDPSKSSTGISNGQSHKQKMDIRKSRGRPPKINTSNQNMTDSDSSSVFNGSKLKDNKKQLSKTVFEQDSFGDKPKQKKNREVANLINMDFGPGKTPFPTTSADRYTEDILTSREKMQTHGYDGRNSRSSVVSNSSRQTSSRRTSQRQSSNLSPPAMKRPRRDAQRNVSYKHSPDFEEEEDEDDDQESMDLSEIKTEERRTPVNVCLYCKNPARDPNLPQYCNEECKRKFKKKQRLETFSNKYLNTSTTSTTSFKSEPATSTPQPPKVNNSSRMSLDNSSIINKSDPLNVSQASNGSAELDVNARELDTMKALGVKNWDTSQVARWVELVCGSTEIGAKFKEQEIDGDSLLLLDENELKQDLGLKLGPYMKLMKDLKKIKSLV